MDALEKILTHILQNARAEEKNILNEAYIKAEEINKREETVRKEKEAAEKINTNDAVNEVITTGIANNRLWERQILLEEKGKIIEKTISLAKEKMLNADKAEYQKILKTLLKKSMLLKKGKIVFAKNEREKIDERFIKELEEASNGMLQVCDMPCNIKNGFIIRYENIDINCSLDAIFEEKHNELVDLVNEYIKAC